MINETFKQHEFTIYDSDGLWGSMRMPASSEDDAESLIISTLEREEVEPNGSLRPDFRLERLSA